MNTKLNQAGGLNVLLIPLILAVLLLLGAIGFGAWAFTSRMDYKDNTDQIVEEAVGVAVERAKSDKDNEFLQREKEPLKGYSSPSQYGSFSLKYPKTWSAYSNEQADQLTLTMQPDVVSSNGKTAYALKVEVLGTPYEQTLRQLESNIKQGKATASAYALPKVPDVVGLRIDGEVAQGKTGSAVYLPLRDKTIKIVSETQDRVPDFDSIILPNFEFRP